MIATADTKPVRPPLLILRVLAIPLIAYAALAGTRLVLDLCLLATRHMSVFLPLGPQGLLRSIQLEGPVIGAVGQFLGDATMVAVTAVWMNPYLRWRDTQFLKWRLRYVLYGILIIVPLFIGLNVLFILLSFLHLPPGLPVQAEYVEHFRAVWEILLITASAGIGEEIVFRGYLLRGLLLFMPAWAAVLLESALFALMHTEWGLGWGSIIGDFVIGITLSLIAMRTKNLTQSITTHFAWDATQLLLSLARLSTWG